MSCRHDTCLKLRVNKFIIKVHFKGSCLHKSTLDCIANEESKYTIEYFGFLHLLNLLWQLLSECSKDFITRKKHNDKTNLNKHYELSQELLFSAWWVLISSHFNVWSLCIDSLGYLYIRVLIPSPNTVKNFYLLNLVFVVISFMCRWLLIGFSSLSKLWIYNPLAEVTTIPSMFFFIKIWLMSFNMNVTLLILCLFYSLLVFMRTKYCFGNEINSHWDNEN